MIDSVDEGNLAPSYAPYTLGSTESYRVCIGIIGNELGLFRDNGKSNANYYTEYKDNGKENGSYYLGSEFLRRPPSTVATGIYSLLQLRPPKSLRISET